MATTPRDSYKDLVLWRKSVDLAAAIHNVTRGLPRSEMFGLVSQMRRASVSIPSNVAEGSARRTTREFIAFLHISRGSLSELETQLTIARQVGYLEDQVTAGVDALIDEVGRLINAVIAGLRKRLG